MRFDQIIQESKEQLDEVRMGQSDLDAFVNGPEAQGIVAGFEAELCFRGKGGQGGEPDYDNPEEDMSEDRRVRGIEDIGDFFHDGDYNGRRDIEQLKSDMYEAYYEWRSEQMSERWHEVEDDQVREYIENNDWDFDEAVEDYLRDDLGLSEAQISAAIEAGIEYSGFTSTRQQREAVENSEAMAHYAEAADHANDLLDEKVQEAIDSQDRNYDNAREEWEEENLDDSDWDEETWLDNQGINRMSEVPGNYDISWPYYTYPENESSNEFNEVGADELAYSLRRMLDVNVATGSYHSVRRKPGLWIIEEDGSLEADEGDMPAETVSPPMPLGECLAKMQEYFEWAEGEDAYSNESTGLHVGMSLPFIKGNVDYVKLALFLGDQYVLQNFDRMSNTYCKSALSKIQSDVRNAPDRVQNAMELMRKGLIELAAGAIKQTSGHGKYTSINLKGDYVEFRSMGGDYFEHVDQVINTVKRYAYAMYIASRPDLYRDEYAKKLYKLLSGDGDQNIINYFSQYSAGKLSKEQLLGILRAAKTKRQGGEQPGSYWWVVKTPGGVGTEVQAANKAEAGQKAAQIWRVPQANPNWTIEVIRDPARIEALNNRANVDI